MDEYLGIIEQLNTLDPDTLNPNALAQIVSEHVTSPELDAAMQAMADVMGIGVDSQLALFVPVLNNGFGIVDGEAIESVVYLLGADAPLEIINVTDQYEIDGEPVADADVPDEDDAPITQVPTLDDITDLIDLEKLTPSLYDLIDTDPVVLVGEILDLLATEVPIAQSASHAASSKATSRVSGYTSSNGPVSGIIRKEWRVRGAIRVWRPCGKTQDCSLRIDTRVQLIRSETPGGEVSKYLRICSGGSYWRMGDPQYFDEDTDQGYYMYRAKEEFGTCNSSGNWANPPSWLHLNRYRPVTNTQINAVSTLNIEYPDNNGLWRSWDAQWTEEGDRRDWDIDITDRTNRVTWDNTMDTCQEGFHVWGWWSMLYEDDHNSNLGAYHGGRHSRGNSPKLYSACTAVWKTTGDVQSSQRFRIYHKMWVRNTWWDLHWFSDDEKKHREDHARKQFRFYVDFGDV